VASAIIKARFAPRVLAIVRIFVIKDLAFTVLGAVAVGRHCCFQTIFSF
jgi:hypothetical protein